MLGKYSTMHLYPQPILYVLCERSQHKEDASSEAHIRYYFFCVLLSRLPPLSSVSETQLLQLDRPVDSQDPDSKNSSEELRMAKKLKLDNTAFLFISEPH